MSYPCATDLLTPIPHTPFPNSGLGPWMSSGVRVGLRVVMGWGMSSNRDMVFTCEGRVSRLVGRESLGSEISRWRCFFLTDLGKG